MKINKTEFLEALEIVKPGLASKENIEQSTSFAFIENKVVTYNDEISISHPIQGMNITGAVNSTELYALLKKLKKDELEIDVTDSEMNIKCGRVKAGMGLQTEIKLPIDGIGEKGKWFDIPENLLFAMDFVKDCASTNQLQPILTCVHINKKGFVEASDSFRILNVELIGKLPVSTFLIPATSVSKLVKLNPVKIAEGAGWIHFKTENETTISCRVLEGGSFPDTNGFMNVEGEEVVFPEKTLDMLDKAMIFCKNGEGVVISMEESVFKMKSNSDSGWFEETLRIDYTGDPIVFTIAPYLLKGILLKTLNCIISKNRLKFSGKNWWYIAVAKQL